VVCDENGCGVIVDKTKANKVELLSFMVNKKYYYCAVHAKLYDRMVGYYEMIYEKDTILRVDKNGKKIT